MPFRLNRIKVLLIKVEATEGTDAVPGGTDAIKLLEPGTLVPGAELTNDRPDHHNQLLDEAVHTVPSQKYTEFTGRAELRGRGAAYSAGVKPELDAIFQAAGMSVTTSFTGGAEFYEYDTASVNTKSVTAYAWTGLDTGVHVLHKILGARISRLLVQMRAGTPVAVEFTGRGLYVEASDTAVTAPTYQTAVAPPLFAGAGSWGLGAYTAAKVREATFGLENTLQPRPSANAADGLAGYAISRRRGIWTARFEGERISDYNALSKWSTAVSEALNIDIPGGTGTQYNRVKLDADKATILEAPTYEDDSGLELLGLSGKLTPEGTNRVKIRFD